MGCVPRVHGSDLARLVASSRAGETRGALEEHYQLQLEEDDQVDRRPASIGEQVSSDRFCAARR
jgi:hypothetical protein